MSQSRYQREAQQVEPRRTPPNAPLRQGDFEGFLLQFNTNVVSITFNCQYRNGTPLGGEMSIANGLAGDCSNVP